MDNISQLIYHVKREAERMGLTDILDSRADDREDLIILALTYYADHLQDALKAEGKEGLSL